MSDEIVKSSLAVEHEGLSEKLDEEAKQSDALLPVESVPSDNDIDYSVLGDLVRNSPAFQQLLAQKIANSRPVLQRIPLQKARDYQLTFDSEWLSPGESATIERKAGAYFKGDRLLAQVGDEDGNDVVGGVVIDYIAVGQRIQESFRGVNASVFTPSSLGSGNSFDTLQPALSMVMKITNVSRKRVRLFATIFGKAIV